MSNRFGLLGTMVSLLLAAFLVACGSSYNASSNGLVIVGSQGSGVLETFSLTLNNGHVSAISNSPSDTSNKTCVLNGVPGAIIVDPAGAYAYAILKQNSSCSGSANGLLAFTINSDGSIKQAGTLVPDPNPISLAIDSAGKFLFVAEGSGVNVYGIGSGGSLTQVANTFTAPSIGLPPNLIAVAASPTKFPAIGINGTTNSVCSVPGNNPPTAEFLYAVDSVNYVVWEFSVDATTGALGNPPGASTVALFPTDKVPAGIAVDPCDRFVYVSDSLTNKISAYTMCVEVISGGQCPIADGSLHEVAGSPFALAGSANGPGPLVVDPFGKNVYVVGTLSNTVSGFTISSVSGSLTALSPATVATGTQPTSIAIRGDDNWMFVTNYGSATVSQYSITPASGLLSVSAPISTDNNPWGVAVK